MDSIESYIHSIETNIPQALKDLKIFLCYDDRDKPSYANYSESRVNELKKKPRDLRGIPYSINKKCFTFYECIESIRQGKNSGIGIVADNDLIGLDFDYCIKEIKKMDKLGLEIPIIQDEIQEIVNKLDNTYIEISQSGKGLHCLIYSSIAIAREIKDNIKIEIYANKNHFMRLSGNIYYNGLGDKCNNLLDKTDVLLDIYNKYFDLKDDSVKDSDGNNKKYISNKEYSFRDIDFKKQFNGLSNKHTKEEILRDLFKKDAFYYKLYNNNLTAEDIDKYNSKRKGRGLKDTSNSGLSVLLILNLMYYSYGDEGLIFEIWRESRLYKKEYDLIKWRAKNLTKADMIFNYCKSRFRIFKKDERLK
jgi:primase-polymerase (primpol)-like protein